MIFFKRHPGCLVDRFVATTVFLAPPVYAVLRTCIFIVFFNALGVDLLLPRYRFQTI